MRGLLRICIIALPVMLAFCTPDHSTHQHAVPAEPETRVDDVLMLNASQIRLANITTGRIGQKQTGQSWIVNARLAVDEDRSTVISSRAAGRVEQLVVRETGRLVRKGEPLYSLYSEELLTLQQEFLLAADQALALGNREPRYTRMEEAAARKLVLYGLTPAQVDNLRTKKVADPIITLLAPAAGLMTELMITEGQYVNEGTPVMRIESLTKLWVEAEVYPHEVGLMRVGDPVTVIVKGFDQYVQQTTITFISPAYESNSQIVLVRASLDNPQLRFQPGMQAEVKVQQPMRSAMVLPTDAVIRESRGAHVYVQTDVGTFVPRLVTLGYENFDGVEIKSGLAEGDTVVMSGAYLLYSEFVLKKGINPLDHLLEKK